MRLPNSKFGRLLSRRETYVKSFKTRAARSAAAVAISAGLVLASGSAAEAARWVEKVDLNCYSFQVIISSRSTAFTEHYHYLPGGARPQYQWNNGAANTYRISAYANYLVEAEVRSTGYLNSASRFCDH